MFKKLLAALRGTQAGTPAAEPITAYDADGQALHIARDDWRGKLLRPALQQAWDDADALYRQILTALNDGFAAELEAAGKRLVEIDANIDRSHTTLGIVQLQNGQLDAAEATLRAGMAQAGETGALLTNLAKVQAERGDEALSEQTLWQAVQKEPNLENALMWWASIQRERHGEAAYLDALRAAAALPGSWCPQLWLARHYLEQQDLDTARALLAEIVHGGHYDRYTLMTISSELGAAGQLPLMLELVAPAYDEQRDDPRAGLNLLRACLELGRIDEGRALLARLQALGFPPIQQPLDQFAQAFGATAAA